jgi:ribonuclease P protein component
MKFSRQNRLLKPAQFQSVFRRPNRSIDRYFKVLARENESNRHRLGLAVAKKTCRRAVDRNRIKRIIRESFRHHLAGNPEDKTMDFVVINREETATVGNTMLRDSLERHWQRLMTGGSEIQTRTQT